MLLLAGLTFAAEPIQRNNIAAGIKSTDTLCTPNPSVEAVALYRYLHDMFGMKILSGQMWVPWGINEIEYIEDTTGKRPAIAGFDYIDNNANNGETQKAINYWTGGGIPTIMWHWGHPVLARGMKLVRPIPALIAVLLRVPMNMTISGLNSTEKPISW